MLNQVVLVGRISKDIEFDEEKNVAFITISVPRAYKNSEGIYESDLVKVELLEGVAKNAKEYCNKGDIVGVKATIRAEEDNPIRIVADKLTFLSSNNKEESSN